MRILQSHIHYKNNIAKECSQIEQMLQKIPIPIYFLAINYTFYISRYI